MNALELEVFSLHATCSSCPGALRKDERHKALLRSALSALKIRQAGRQAAPTCYMDRHKGHRIFLGPSNSFLLLSCPYWFGPFPLRCVPVVLIKHKHFIPTVWSRWKGTKKKKDKEKKTSDIHSWQRTGHYRAALAPSTYLLQGHMKRPQHFPKSFKFFSASFMSWLIWFMPSSTRSSCSGQDKGMTVWNELIFFFLVVAVCLQQKMKKKDVWGNRIITMASQCINCSWCIEAKMEATLEAKKNTSPFY